MTLIVPHTLYGMWDSCNCQWLLWCPHTSYGMWEPCKCQWLLRSPHTWYRMWESCNCQWLLWSPTCMIWWSPLTLYVIVIIWSPHIYDMIFSGLIILVMLMLEWRWRQQQWRRRRRHSPIIYAELATWLNQPTNREKRIAQMTKYGI